MKIIILLIQAILLIVSACAVPDSNFKVWVDRAAYEITINDTPKAVIMLYKAV